MTNLYPIIQIAKDAPELPEQQGTKTKYWIRKDEQRYLFKIGRTNTGENWAEKVACELCSLLGLPHAHYDLAVWEDHKGVLSKTIVPPNGRLVMGNELLVKIHSTYPHQQKYKVHDHTIGRIFSLLSSPDILLPKDWEAPNKNIKNAVDVFLGYLLLDTWIANQDRHHENWGVINHNNEIYLAPTYDHAASMGQNERDTTRIDRLKTRDKGMHIKSYVEKARSAIYMGLEDKPMLTIDAYQQLANKRPDSAKFWIKQLQNISTKECQNIFDKIPPSKISETAIEFALKLLELNKKRLLKAGL